VDVAVRKRHCALCSSGVVVSIGPPVHILNKASFRNAVGLQLRVSGPISFFVILILSICLWLSNNKNSVLFCKVK